jgi:pepsin A
MFSLYLTKPEMKGSKLIFGGVDMAYAKHPDRPIIYADIIKNDSYRIRIEGIQLLSKTLKIKSALIDSGTSCITLPMCTLEEIKRTFEREYLIHCHLKVEESSPDYSLL